MSKVAASALVLACVLCATGASAEAEALSVRQVVAIAKQNSPQLKAALLELESAEWNVFGNEARYEPVLLLEASGTQTSTPNVFVNSVRISRIRRLDGAAELRKHLIWGTDLALRLSGGSQWSHFTSIGSSTVPSMVGGMGGVGTTGYPTSLFGIGNFGPVYSMIAKLTLKQPLWRGRGRDVGEAPLREAKVQRSVNRYARDRVNSEQLRDVLTAYWELWYAEAAVVIQAHSRGVATRQRDEAAARAATGSLARADVLTFETQVATRAEQLVDAHAERDRRAHELARLLGTSVPATSLGSPGDEPEDLHHTAGELVEQRALSNSAELHEREQEVELARVRQKTADDPSKPRLDLDAYGQAQGFGNESVNDAAEQFVRGDVLSAFVGLTFEAPLRGRVRRAESAKARLATEVSEEHLKQARASVLAEVRGALDREQASREKVELTEQTAAIAQRQLEAEQARYLSGSSTPLAVLEAEDQVRSAQLRLARARADLTETALVVEHLTGALLARYAAL
jgi:outer membrane protein